MVLDDETVQALARHAGLDRSPAQVAELAALIAHLETLAAVDIEGVPPFSHAGATSDPRVDTPGPAFSADEALAGAATRRGEHVVVPRPPGT